MPFTNTWTALQTHLEAGATIPNWTARNGLTGDPFEVVSVSRNVILLDAPGATTLQAVRRTDFEKLYPLWDDYVGKQIPRSSFNPLTRYSKYVISILHWLEVRSGGRLP